MLLVWSIVTFALALFFLRFSRKLHRKSGLPYGQVVYFDDSELDAFEKVLYDLSIGLAGKPDYIVKDKKMFIPVEVKSTRTPTEPYDAHIYQLASYCRLIEREYGHRPKYGIIQYPQKKFAIDYTRGLESALLDIIEEMRSVPPNENAARSHQDSGRCNGCGYRQECDQRI